MSDALRTIVLMRSMLLSRIGQVLSVETHSARPRPQPHEQRALLASLRAAFFPFCDKSEKLTTPMARSSNGTPADWVTAYTMPAVSARPSVHLSALR